MEITKEKIEELKKAHGDIFQGSITYVDENGITQKIEFIHKVPTYELFEKFQIDAAKMSPIVAEQNLVVSLILEPSGIEMAAAFTKCPLAMDRWFQNNILPRFGGNVMEASSRKL